MAGITGPIVGLTWSSIMRIHWQLLLLGLITTMTLDRPCRADPEDEKKPYPTLGTIERVDPRFDQLIPRDAVLEKLAEGFKWSEGPVWVRDGQLPALLRHPQQPRHEVEGRRGAQPLPQAQRLHGHGRRGAANRAPTA